MVRVMWARLFGWTNVGESLELIFGPDGRGVRLGLSAAARTHGSGWMTRLRRTPARTIGVRTVVSVWTHNSIATGLKPNKINKQIINPSKQSTEKQRRVRKQQRMPKRTRMSCFLLNMIVWCSPWSHPLYHILTGVEDVTMARNL